MNDSLLSLVVQDEKVTKILNYIRESVHSGKSIQINPEEMLYIKKKFQDGILVGEEGLHALSFELIQKLADLSKAKTTLIVWGRCPYPHHPDIVKSYTHIELNQVLSSEYMDSVIAWSHTPVCKVCKKKTTTIASFNQYKFDESFPSGLKILLSRIKTTSNICYKIADMVFDIDRMFQRDKIFNKYTQVLTDMYGIKMAFENEENIFQIVKNIQENPEVKILSEKNYLGQNKKQSGYEAFKIVLQKNNQLFELQLQTQKMLDIERSSLKASHKTYKEKQIEERRKIGDDYHNLYNLLIQMFSDTSNDLLEYKEA